MKVNEAPEKIYVHVRANKELGTTWHGTRIGVHDIEYIRTDTLEVKEVGLDNEYIEEVYSHLDSIKDTAERMTSGNFMHHRAAIKFSANTIAKVLELMGFKVQKGE